MKWIIAIICLLSITLTYQKSNAYAVDVHFYETYLMLRKAGFTKEFAKKVASAAQWPDVSILNSALNPIPFYHARVSRLVHFPAEGITFEFLDKLDEVQDFKEFTELGRKFLEFKKKIKEAKSLAHGDMDPLFNIAKEMDAVAEMMFMEAAKIGSDVLLGSSIHAIMDTFAHAGNNSIAGHGLLGNFPDRAWLFQERHNKMREHLFKLFVRIRDIVPDSAIDKNFKMNNSDIPEYKKTAAQLYNEYINDPKIIAMTQFNPMLSEPYTKFAIEEILKYTKEQGFISKEITIEYFIEAISDNLFKSQLPALEILEMIVDHLLHLNTEQKNQMLDINKIYKKFAPEMLATTISANGQSVMINASDLAGLHITLEELKTKFVDHLSGRFIPRNPVDNINDLRPNESWRAPERAVLENEALRAVELAISIANYQDIIEHFTGERVFFVDKKTPKEFAEELIKKHGHELDKIEELLKNIDIATLTKAHRAEFMNRMANYVIVDAIKFMITWPLYKIKILKQAYGDLRMRAMPGSTFWRSDEAWQKLVEAGIVKSVTSTKELERLAKQHARMTAQYKAAVNRRLNPRLKGLLDKAKAAIAKRNLSSSSNLVSSGHISHQCFKLFN